MEFVKFDENKINELPQRFSSLYCKEFFKKGICIDPQKTLFYNYEYDQHYKSYIHNNDVEKHECVVPYYKKKGKNGDKQKNKRGNTDINLPYRVDDEKYKKRRTLYLKKIHKIVPTEEKGEKKKSTKKKGKKEMIWRLNIKMNTGTKRVHFCSSQSLLSILVKSSLKTDTVCLNK